MTATDLIRLAHELVEHGGVHRLTNLVTAALHVCLEHDRASWPPTLRAEPDDSEAGVGMSDKAAPAHAASRMPEREGEWSRASAGGPPSGTLTVVAMPLRELTAAVPGTTGVGTITLSANPAPSRAPEREDKCG